MMLKHGMPKVILLIVWKDLKKAIRCYDKAIELDQNNTRPWTNKGNVLGKLERNNEAITYFDKAIELDPKNINAWNNKLTTLKKLGKHEEVENVLLKLIELNKNEGSSEMSKQKVTQKEERKIKYYTSDGIPVYE